MEVESKEYSWAWVTASRLLSHGACELLYAMHVPNQAGGSTSDIYDGENTSGDKIATLKSINRVPTPFAPPKPIYCRRGLYVDHTANVLGDFVQWRELGHKAGG